jgi:hypothetical protein
MRELTPQEMMAAWEAGQGHSLAHKALLLLSYANPELTWDTLAALPIGERDSRLLQLREWMFGRELTSLASCPTCREELELTFSVGDLRIASPKQEQQPLSVEQGDYRVEFRLLNSADLEQLAGVDDIRTHLLRRCVEGAWYRGKKRAFSRLPASVMSAVVQKMGDADPQADVHTALTCPECGYRWEAMFDIVSFFWEEIDSWVLRTLREVHLLASAYCWRESDILALSPWRRQYYLQMVQQ